MQKQVLQFVLEAVRAEAFNPATLFLFGSYTIGKERLFLEVARILQRKVSPHHASLPSHSQTIRRWCRCMFPRGTDAQLFYSSVFPQHPCLSWQIFARTCGL